MSDAPHDAVERHVTVPRTARYFALGAAAGAREVWVALHGYGQLASYFARHFAPLTHERLVVVPEGLSRFYLEAGEPARRRVGATWMTREDRDAEIADYVRWLDLALADATSDVSAPLHVLGFSQGTATACRWLAHRARTGRPAAARLVLWAGDVPPDTDLTAAWLRATRLTLVHAEDDPLVPAERVAESRSRLDAAGVDYDVVTYVGGHRMPAAALAGVVDR